jgi:O-methyltransferase involved in polyketide biosynthesis
MAGFERISLTARLTAYMRQFSDIPFAADVAERLRALEAFESLLRDHELRPEDMLWYAPVFEVRYRSIEAAIRASGATQVLELASGLSLRGLAMTRDPALTYVETDLPDLTAEKRALVDELRREHGIVDHGNLHLVSANALDADELASAAAHLRPGATTAIVCEGLLQYLERGEIETVAGNVRALLDSYPGVWLTPDFTLRTEAAPPTEQRRRFRALVEGATERKMYAGSFADADELDGFLASIGFSARLIHQLDLVPRVTSMERVGLPPSLLERMKPRLKLWTMLCEPAWVPPRDAVVAS